ncbi:pentapeptide repeat-containing protein [Tolypothrix campylonemoides VB511288_2]|uniref:Pentapeptide repeat-containing protein n=2 Tax=Tolypothrix TaxID=111782 RepID=A0A8S9T5L7_9CYAN|nr:pentapeptide repeat-containing protein [Tolypothrix bouteillei]KAF3886829.1 pentapeptide repeat-containing protein [Tolypothrix bouteillei VB521301]
MDTQELLRRYALGERDFSNVNMVHVCLTNANLVGAHLIGAHLIHADLRGVEQS